MPQAESTSNLRNLEGRLKRALDIIGVFPLRLSGDIVPTMELFNADRVGFHTYTGRRFAGSSTVIGAVGGQGKVIVRAAAECVLDDHTLTNLAGAAGTFNIRILGPATADAFAFTEALTFWVEQFSAATEFAGLFNAVSNDATTLGSIIWRGAIPALSSVQVKLPIHLLAGGRVIYHDQTTNQEIAAAWHGYVI